VSDARTLLVNGSDRSKTPARPGMREETVTVAAEAPAKCCCPLPRKATSPQPARPGSFSRRPAHSERGPGCELLDSGRPWQTLIDEVEQRRDRDAVQALGEELGAYLRASAPAPGPGRARLG
jgi:hypothetical protein